MPTRVVLVSLLAGAVAMACPLSAFAQAASTADPVAQATAPSAPATEPPPATAAVVEIDQTLVNLPTTQPLLRHHGYFRLTHRFARDLFRGSFGDLAQDFFSLDSGAVMGLEYRYGITSTLQAGAHRSTLGKTLEPFARWDVVRQSTHMPVSISPILSIEGQNNLRQDPQPGVSVTVSHVHSTWMSVYATPAYVHNSHTETLRLLHEGHMHDLGDAEDPDEHSTAVDTFYLGLGARVRVLETVSFAVESAPRISGYKPDYAAWGAAIEKETHGHVLQLNFGNSFSTTPGMIARGGAKGEVYLGFNLSRKF